MPNPKNGDKLSALIVFGRFRSSNLNQAAVFLKKDAEAAKKAASDARLSTLEVQTEEHRQAAATLPEGTINAQGRFSLSPASPGIIAELERLFKAATGQGATSASGAKTETASTTISADLWRQLKPGMLVLAAGFDEDFAQSFATYFLATTGVPDDRNTKNIIIYSNGLCRIGITVIIHQARFKIACF